MPMYLHQPTANPFDRLVNKLIAAGWATASVSVDKGNGEELGRIVLTDKGRTKLALMLTLFREVEAASMTLQRDELQYFKMLAELATGQTGSQPGGPPPAPGRM
jgi:hypothetical protein